MRSAVRRENKVGPLDQGGEGEEEKGGKNSKILDKPKRKSRKAESGGER